MMVLQTSRRLFLVAIVALLPLAGLPPVEAHHKDECAGGIDASGWLGDPTPLVVFEGCTGALYQPPGNSSHPTDLYDAYQLNSKEGRLLEKSKIYFQICNHGEVGFLYELWWKSDNSYYERMRVAWLGEVGQCSTEEPELVQGRSHPGRWMISVEALDGMYSPGMQNPYYIHAIVY